MAATNEVRELTDAELEIVGGAGWGKVLLTAGEVALFGGAVGESVARFWARPSASAMRLGKSGLERLGAAQTLSLALVL
jgi:hypothetical protein